MTETDNSMPPRQRVIPPLAYYDWEFQISSDRKPNESGHKVSCVELRNVGFTRTRPLPENVSKYFFQKDYETKKMTPDQVLRARDMAEVESATAEFARTCLGLLAPEQRPVFDQHGKPLYSVSRELPDFVPLIESRHSDEELINGGLPESFAFCAFVANDDCHRGNLGFKGLIDFDMALWPLTSEIKGERDTVSKVFTAYQPPKRAFPVTARDIRSMPNIQDMFAFYWPTNILSNIVNPQKILRKEMYSEDDRQRFIRMSNSSRYQYKNYYQFLKMCVVPDEHLDHIAQALIGEPEWREKWVALLKKRIALYRNTLLNMPEFRQFILEHGDEALTQIQYEFEHYSQSHDSRAPEQRDDVQYLNDDGLGTGAAARERDRLRAQAHASLQVDLKSVAEKYAAIAHFVHEQPLAMAMHKLNEFVSKRAPTLSPHADFTALTTKLHALLQRYADGADKPEDEGEEAEGDRPQNDYAHQFAAAKAAFCQTQAFRSLGTEMAQELETILNAFSSTLTKKAPGTRQTPGEFKAMPTARLDPVQILNKDQGIAECFQHSTPKLFQWLLALQSPQLPIGLAASEAADRLRQIEESAANLRQAVMDACKLYLRESTEEQTSPPTSGPTPASSSSSITGMFSSLATVTMSGLSTVASATQSVADRAWRTQQQPARDLSKRCSEGAPIKTVIEKYFEIISAPTGGWTETSLKPLLCKKIFSLYHSEHMSLSPMNLLTEDQGLFRLQNYYIESASGPLFDVEKEQRWKQLVGDKLSALYALSQVQMQAQAQSAVGMPHAAGQMMTHATQQRSSMM